MKSGLKAIGAAEKGETHEVRGLWQEREAVPDPETEPPVVEVIAKLPTQFAGAAKYPLARN